MIVAKSPSEILGVYRAHINPDNNARSLRVVSLDGDENGLPDYRRNGNHAILMDIPKPMFMDIEIDRLVFNKSIRRDHLVGNYEYLSTNLENVSVDILRHAIGSTLVQSITAFEDIRRSIRSDVIQDVLNDAYRVRVQLSVLKVTNEQYEKLFDMDCFTPV
jgi:hypothetical protein